MGKNILQTFQLENDFILSYDTGGDSHHRAALALDINSSNFRFDGGRGSSFDRDKAVKYAEKMLQHGASEILLNCPYVKEKVNEKFPGRVNSDYNGHHHHSHVSYHTDYGDAEISTWNCVLFQGGIAVYKCKMYDDEKKKCKL